MIAALVWFIIAYFTHQSLIGMAIGAKSITPQAPKLFNALENLCVARGLPMPALQIIRGSCAQLPMPPVCARVVTW